MSNICLPSKNLCKKDHVASHTKLQSKVVDSRTLEDKEDKRDKGERKYYVWTQLGISQAPVIAKPLFASILKHPLNPPILGDFDIVDISVPPKIGGLGGQDFDSCKRLLYWLSNGCVAGIAERSNGFASPTRQFIRRSLHWQNFLPKLWPKRLIVNLLISKEFGSS